MYQPESRFLSSLVLVLSEVLASICVLLLTSVLWLNNQCWPRTQTLVHIVACSDLSGVMRLS